MGFWFKKIVSAFLLPLPLGVMLLAIGLTIHWMNRVKKQKNYCLMIGFLLIALFSSAPISSALVNSLQSQYAPLLYPPTNVNTVVVLGGGVSGNKNLPANLTLNSISLSRLIEGIRLLYQIPASSQPRLVLSGGRVFQTLSVSGKMQNTATMLGVPHQEIVLENGSQDTYEEAIYLKKLLDTKPFILVTSATHMPRAMALFKKQGMQPIAAPTQFIGGNDALSDWFPITNNNLINSDVAIHEYLGLAWGKLNGLL